MAKSMKTERKLNKLLSAAGIILVALCIMLSSAYAVPAAEEKGSLTLRCVFPVGDSHRVLSNDEYSLVKIADAFVTDDSVEYRTLGRFMSYDCKWSRLSASNMNEKAKALAFFCENNGLYTKAGTTGENGEVCFEDLGIGLYLVARTKTASENSDFNTDPLLFFVPQNVNGEAVYHIVATPKFSYSSYENPLSPDDPGSPSDSSLPQTGQLLWPITLLAVLGCFLILSGSFLLRREARDEQ